MKRLLLIILFWNFCILKVNSQARPSAETEYPIVGKTCPDFTLDDVRHFSKTKVSAKDFRGKWLILDFWHKHCGACFSSMQKMDSLQQLFNDQIQIIMVGYKEEGASKLYEMIRKKFNLQLPVAYDRYLWDKKFIINGAPYILVLDDKGVVRAITHTIGKTDMDRFLKGENPLLPPSSQSLDYISNQIKLDLNKPLLLNGNGGPDSAFLFRTILYPWSPYMGYRFSDFSNYNNWNSPERLSNGIQIIGGNLKILYMIAYFGAFTISPDDSLYGNYWPQPILELKDSARFESDANGKNRFCYSHIVPRHSANQFNLQEGMKMDLRIFFGYEAKVETRKMPYWKLVAKKTQQKTVADSIRKRKANTLLEAIRNDTLEAVSMMDLVTILAWNYRENIPIIDETGVNFRINIYFPERELRFGSLDDKLRFIRMAGLDIEKGEKEMKTLVIKNAKID